MTKRAKQILEDPVKGIGVFYNRKSTDAIVGWVVIGIVLIVAAIYLIL